MTADPASSTAVELSFSANEPGFLRSHRVFSFFACEAKTVADQRLDLRKFNLNPVRATEKDLALRDSSLKKNTAFVRKIVSFFHFRVMFKLC